MSMRTHTFTLAFVRYAFVRWDALEACPGRRLRGGEAERVLMRALRADAARLRRIYAERSHQFDISRIQNDVVLARLVAWVSAADGHLALVELEGPSQRPEAVVDPQTRRIDALLRELGKGPLQQRGEAYRILRVELLGQVAERAGYETLGAREARQVLAQAAGEPTRTAQQREALVELGASIERIVVLRRVRSYAVPREREAAATPSQLRREMSTHYVELLAQDEQERPVSGVRVQVLLAQGGTTSLVTKADGIARLDHVAPGSVTIRVLSLDGTMWRPESGAAAQRAQLSAGGRTHVVKRGDNLSRIARAYGLKRWQQLWDDPRNEPLRKKRKSPHILHAGDEVHVPGADVYEIVRDTDATHRIVVKVAEVCVRLRLHDLLWNPHAKLEYDYSFTTGGVRVEKPGSAPTDDNGDLVERVPVDVTTVTVVLRESKQAFVLSISSLPPARNKETNEPIASGIRAHLASLGYACDGDGSELGDGDRAALAAFQADELEKKEPSGIPDGETLDALERVYLA